MSTIKGPLIRFILTVAHTKVSSDSSTRVARASPWYRLMSMSIRPTAKPKSLGVGNWGIMLYGIFPKLLFPKWGKFI